MRRKPKHLDLLYLGESILPSSESTPLLPQVPGRSGEVREYRAVVEDKENALQEVVGQGTPEVEVYDTGLADVTVGEGGDGDILLRDRGPSVGSPGTSPCSKGTPNHSGEWV